MGNFYIQFDGKSRDQKGMMFGFEPSWFKGEIWWVYISNS